MDDCCNRVRWGWNEGGGGEESKQFRPKGDSGGRELYWSEYWLRPGHFWLLVFQNKNSPPPTSWRIRCHFAFLDWRPAECRLLTASSFCTVSTTREKSRDMSKSQTVSEELQPIKAIAGREGNCSKQLQFPLSFSWASGLRSSFGSLCRTNSTFRRTLFWE